MDLKGVLVIVCLCALAITSTDAGIPKCCIRTRNISVRQLVKVVRWERQDSRGVCDIDALRLYQKGKPIPICAHPQVEVFIKKLRDKMPWLQQQKTKRN
ncbi:C-C motif chemokine 27a [Odontesthes bonariensis]|uniref:C-C motif chemokine 27a n=1 Tax=Odontesthes bonariensis TaxID=219752 RepID=UPI003F58C852